MQGLIAFSLLFPLSAAVKLPPNFHKCNRKQPDFNECVLEAANHGVTQLTQSFKDLDVPNLDPFYLPEATISGGSGRVAVDQKFKNCKLYGLPTIKFDKFEIRFDVKKIEVSGFIPEVKKLCDYEMKGQLMIFPINGKGNSTIVLKNLNVSATYNFEEIHKKKETYLNITWGNLTFDPGLVTYEFQNAVDKTVSDNINQVLNENWKEVFDEVKSGYIEIINRIVINIFNKLFSQVSVEEAFD